MSSIEVDGTRRKGGAAARPMGKRVMKFFTRLNVVVYRLSGGHLMNKMNGTPICLVTMTGRKSGKKITRPLMYNPSGDNVVLVASMGGAPEHPVWYHNMVACPEVEIEVKGKPKRRMRVHLATAEEKAGLWPGLVQNFPNFEIYAERTDRDIPVLICSPA